MARRQSTRFFVQGRKRRLNLQLLQPDRSLFTRIDFIARRGWIRPHRDHDIAVLNDSRAVGTCGSWTFLLKVFDGLKVSKPGIRPNGIVARQSRLLLRNAGAHGTYYAGLVNCSYAKTDIRPRSLRRSLLNLNRYHVSALGALKRP
jgi:hypothetical protein